MLSTPSVNRTARRFLIKSHGIGSRLPVRTKRISLGIAAVEILDRAAAYKQQRQALLRTIPTSLSISSNTKIKKVLAVADEAFRQNTHQSIDLARDKLQELSILVIDMLQARTLQSMHSNRSYRITAPKAETFDAIDSVLLRVKLATCMDQGLITPYAALKGRGAANPDIWIDQELKRLEFSDEEIELAKADPSVWFKADKKFYQLKVSRNNRASQKEKGCLELEATHNEPVPRGLFRTRFLSSKARVLTTTATNKSKRAITEEKTGGIRLKHEQTVGGINPGPEVEGSKVTVSNSGTSHRYVKFVELTTAR